MCVFVLSIKPDTSPQQNKPEIFTYVYARVRLIFICAKSSSIILTFLFLCFAVIQVIHLKNLFALLSVRAFPTIVQGDFLGDLCGLPLTWRPKLAEHGMVLF